MDSILRFRCEACREVHVAFCVAQSCCPPVVVDVYLCRSCGVDYEDEGAAVACCGDMSKQEETQ